MSSIETPVESHTQTAPAMTSESETHPAATPIAIESNHGTSTTSPAASPISEQPVSKPPTSAEPLPSLSSGHGEAASPAPAATPARPPAAADVSSFDPLSSNPAPPTAPTITTPVPSSNPRIESLRAIFPDYDPGVLESVLDSVNGNEERAADVLLGMNDPDYVSQEQQRPPPTQTELDEEFAKRLVFEEQQQQQYNADWVPHSGRGGGVPYQARQNAPHPQGQGQGQQGGDTMEQVQQQLNKFAETGKKTFTSLFNKVKAKVDEFDAGRAGNAGPPPQEQQQQQQWAGQSQSYYAPPSQPPSQQQGYDTGPQSNIYTPSNAGGGGGGGGGSQSQGGYQSAAPPRPSEPRLSSGPAGMPEPGVGGSSQRSVDPSKIGMLPKRPVSLVGNKPKTPPPSRKDEDDNDLGYVENPFEDRRNQ